LFFLQDEIRSLKKRIEDLENQLKASQKAHKDKDKLVEETNRNV
jgi:septal ring factor EnvC (AmiA/AmiB activator)